MAPFPVLNLAHMMTASTPVQTLLQSLLGENETRRLERMMYIPVIFQKPGDAGFVTRAELAFAFNMLLFRDLLERVPEGKAYTIDAMAQGRKVFFDHGAVRTVDIAANSALPMGEAALTRVLLPLGYRLNEVYPLPHLQMTGRAYFHPDLPEEMPQFFVSELHVARFSPAFQQAAARVVATSSDPLSTQDMQYLAQLERAQGLPIAQAKVLLPALLRCFARQHETPALSDYEILLRESHEMAWIATEGNAFNHVTDRVEDLQALSDEQRGLGRSIKPKIEVAARGSLRQTAYRAAEVERVFIDRHTAVVRKVPGSFYEFISRDRVNDVLDLGFDSSNASAIFKMTSVELAA